MSCIIKENTYDKCSRYFSGLNWILRLINVREMGASLQMIHVCADLSVWAGKVVDRNNIKEEYLTVKNKKTSICFILRMI